LVLLSLLTLTACSKVPAGHVGIKFYLLGGAKGADTEELGAGRYWIGWNEELFLFPTFTQNYTWTREPIDGDTTDESITFQTDQGLSVNADVGISYTVDPTAAEAEADKVVEEARGVAESTLLKAKGEAEAIRIKGEALRENPRLVELSAIEKWDGKLPQLVGSGALPFVTLPQGK
jgi:hypothetical protein